VQIVKEISIKSAFIHSDLFARRRNRRPKTPWYSSDAHRCSTTARGSIYAICLAQKCYRPFVRLSICPSVRPSQGWISQKTDEVRIMQLHGLGWQHYLTIYCLCRRVIDCKMIDLGLQWP